MSPKEETGFRAVYEQWPSDRLARAATLEKQDYQPEAVLLMLEVLRARGVDEQRLAAVVASVAPPPLQPPEKSTLLFPARLNRTQFLVRWLLWIVVFLGTAVLSEIIPAIQPAAGIIVVLVGLVYIVSGIYIPRMKDAGFSPWLLLLALVPLANLGVLFLLFFVPSKK